MKEVKVKLVVTPGDRCEVLNYRTKKWEGGTVRNIRVTIHPDGERWAQYQVELHRRSKRINAMCQRGMRIWLTVWEVGIREEQD